MPVQKTTQCDLFSKATRLGWTYKTELEDGIRLAYEDFLNLNQN